MADPPATPENASPPAAPNQGTFRLKNLVDLPDDTVLFNAGSENPISFVKNVVARAATPNTFRTRKQFYGRFITQLYEDGSAGKTGHAMFDHTIASIKAAGGEAASIDQMKLFVCVVHVEELQHYPFPAPEDWDAIQKIASGGGIFKSFTYAGLRPNYGDNVLVAFADPATRADGMFLHPDSYVYTVNQHSHNSILFFLHMEKPPPNQYLFEMLVQQIQEFCNVQMFFELLIL